jgi:hypothetical protein
MTARENIVGKSVPCDMLRRHRIPAPMLYRNPHPVAYQFEPHFHINELTRSEALLAAN